MKVAFITHEPFFPPSGGGSAEALYLVQEFTKRGHEVHLFCPRLQDPEAVEKQFGVKLHPFNRWEMGRYTSFRSFKYLLYPSAIQRVVEKAAKSVSFDLVFSQHAISAVAAGRLRERLQIPVVMNFLDYLTGFMETWPAYLAPPPILRQLKKYELSLPNRYRADGVLTVSDTLADYFAHVGYPRERILPIYYGYDSTYFPVRAHSAAEATDQLPTIVMHGSLDHHHLKDIALDAMAFVAQNRPDAVFKFVGRETPALKTFLRKVRRRIPGALVECTGFTPYSEVARQLSDASIGIVPYEESLGTHCAFVAKIVEYLAVGLPVVSTPLDSAVRYFGDEPMVRFSEFDGTSFGRKIMSWLLDRAELRSHFARSASDRVRTNLDWRVISARALDFVEGICRLPGTDWRMKLATDKLTFFRQSGWMVLATVASGVFMTAVHVIVNKPMLPAEYSVFFTLLRVFLLMGFPAAGLQSVFAQQTAAALSEREQRNLSSQTRAVLSATFLIWLAVAGVVILENRQLITMLKITNPAALWVTVLLALASLWAPIVKGLLQGRQHFAGLGWVLILDGVGRFSAIVLIVQLGGQAAGAMTGALAGQLVSLAVGVWLVRGILFAPGAAVQWRPWLRRVIPLTFGAGVVLFMCNFDVVYVQTIFSKDESKFYIPAAMIGLALVTFTTPLASVMFPKVVQSAAGTGQTDAVRKALLATAVLGGAAALACTLLPALPLRIIYFRNPIYWQAAPLVPWFAWSLLPLIMANVLITNLLARDRFRIVPLAVAVAIAYGCALVAQKDSIALFSAADVRNAPALAASISHRADPLSAFIGDQLTPNERQLLSSSGTEPRLLEQLLAQILNRVIQGGAVYTPERLAGTALSERARELLQEPRTGKELVHVNRLLLQEAYPAELVSNLAKLFGGFKTVLRTLALSSCLLLVAAIWCTFRRERLSYSQS